MSTDTVQSLTVLLALGGFGLWLLYRRHRDTMQRIALVVLGTMLLVGIVWIWVSLFAAVGFGGGMLALIALILVAKD
jgi:hypothetical protein